jgi:DNA-binding PadR family transcriptional regulator
MHWRGHGCGGSPPWNDLEFARAHWGGGRRARRGDIRLALLAALGDGPAHGYELCQRLENKSGGRWRPSSGSVYPTLQLLEDQGLVVSEQRDGKRVYSLTDAGRAEVSSRAEPAGAAQAPQGGTEPGAPTQPVSLRDAVTSLHIAAKQIAIAGTGTQRESALGVLVEARRQLYEILAKG